MADNTQDELEPGVAVTGEDRPVASNIIPPPSAQPLILRGPQGPPPTVSGPPVQMLTPEQASNQFMWRRLAHVTQDLPLAQTEQAVSAALRYQGQRQYQQDLASGMSPSEALAKSAPLIFGGPKQGSLGQAASFVRATARPQPKFTDVGGVLYRHNPDGTVTPVTPPRPREMTPYQQAQLQIKQDALSEPEKALLGADTAELKAIEKQLGGTEEHGFGILHPLGGNKAQMDALRKRADDLRQKIRTQYGRREQIPAQPNVPRGTTPQQDLVTVTSKEQWDNLPSGAIYLGKNGKRYRKP